MLKILLVSDKTTKPVGVYPFYIRFVEHEVMSYVPYDVAMSESKATLTLRIDTEQPVEIGAFVGAFTSLAKEYRRQVTADYPDAAGEARIYVKEVRAGSYIAELIPFVAAVAPFVAQMDQVLIAEQFVRVWGQRITALATGQMGKWRPSKSELAVWLDATQAIAADANATSTLEATTFEDGNRNVRAAFKFSTPEARDAQQTIDATWRDLESQTDADHKRVLMIFTRTDFGKAKLGKKSGERVLIEEVHPRPLALMYASELAEQRLKHEIREAEDNVYKKGFVVDVNVRIVNGRPAVYAVTDVHEVIDLPEDDE